MAKPLRIIPIHLQAIPGVDLLAVGETDGANGMKIRVGLYSEAFDAGECHDGRLTGESVFYPNVRVRQFSSSSSGCGIIIKKGRITFLDQGLQNFIGYSARIIRIDNSKPWFILAAWTGSKPPAIIGETELSDVIPKGKRQLIETMDALATLFV